MIGKLRGVVDEIGEDYCLIDVSGVGYIAHCSTRTLNALGKTGEETSLIIETYVREDMFRLYGFLTAAERDWFRALQGHVQGVGAKVALSVLSTLTPSELAGAITVGDITLIAKTPGVGKKVAERIIAELKNKMPATDGVDPSLSQLANASGPAGDAIAALTNLGYSRETAAAAISAILKEADAVLDMGTLIGLGLRYLSKR